jgi:hypothetical protein
MDLFVHGLSSVSLYCTLRTWVVLGMMAMVAGWSMSQCRLYGRQSVGTWESTPSPGTQRQVVETNA